MKVYRRDGTIICEGESIRSVCENEKANLREANLQSANLREANLRYADLRGANLQYADLRYANLQSANLQEADLREADLLKADLRYADLRGADLYYTSLQYADLREANLRGAIDLVKIMGVIQGNFYYKRFGKNLVNNDYQFYVGINKIRKDEIFEADERVLCGYPGFHFASRSWCAVNYPDRPYEALIQIPKGAKINEPWATDGKASADMIKIIQVFDTTTGEDVTDQFRKRS